MNSDDFENRARLYVLGALYDEELARPENAARYEELSRRAEEILRLR